MNNEYLGEINILITKQTTALRVTALIYNFSNLQNFTFDYIEIGNS